MLQISPENKFAGLYQNSFKSIFRFFYYKSVHFDQIEELCQEVYLRFWSNYQPKLDDFVQSKKILYGIALNVYREWIRSQEKDGFIQIGDYWEEFADNDNLHTIISWENSDYEKQQEILKNEIKKMVQDLPSKQKEIIISRYFEGLTRKETAQKFNIPEDQVHTYQKRAVRSLKELLSKRQN